VLLLSAAMTAGAAALWVAEIRDLEALPSPFTLPFWAVPLLVLAAEHSVVRLALFRRDAHGYTLGDIALVTTLFYAGPAVVLAGRVIGAAATDLVQQRSMIKNLFNATKILFETSVAVVVFHRLIALGDPLGTAGWLAALVTVLVIDLLSTILIYLVILVSGAPRPGQPWHHDLVFGFCLTVTTTSLALVGVTVLWLHPSSGWLLLPPALVLFAAFGAYARERPRLGSTEFLYETARTLQQTRRPEDLLGRLLEQAREAFQAELAEALILPRADNGTATRIQIGPGDQRSIAGVPRTDAELGEWAALLGDRRACLVPGRDQRLTGHFTASGVRDAMAVALVGEHGVIGAILVANRRGDATFHEQELQVLETMASHVSSALENTRLMEHLHEQALHDPLTGLPNRSVLQDRLTSALARIGPGDPGTAVLFLDLDGFKAVNDLLGHQAGDELLVAVSRRLQAVLKDPDLLARFAGDEFAIVCHDIGDGSVPERIAERIHQTLADPFRLDKGEARVGASIGIAFASSPGEDPEAVLRAADLAMYEAKRLGKGRTRLASAAVARRH
jgi:diguanylate cyclase (GGDEF)-like protein